MCPPVLSAHLDRFSIFSHSLGDHSVHPLPLKLIAAASGGFKSIELSLIDLEHHHECSKSADLLRSAQEIGDLCKLLGLKVVCLQPLRDVIESKNTHELRQRVLRLFPIMDLLDTELLLICSSSLPADQLDGSFQTAVKNLRTIGLEARNWSPNPKRIAFEALCWGTYINLWHQAWEVVEAVDLDNVGICLDSFNTLAREWADPTLEGGVQPNATKNLTRSLKQLSKQVPGRKIFLLQIGDGARLKEPIEKGSVDQPALMTWSRSSRLFPMEPDLGGYLPVADFVQAVLRTGYDGIWSIEVFNDSLASKADSTPILHAIRALNGLLKLDHFLFGDHQTTYPSLQLDEQQQNALPQLSPPSSPSSNLVTRFTKFELDSKELDTDHYHQSLTTNLDLSPTKSAFSGFESDNCQILSQSSCDETDSDSDHSPSTLGSPKITQVTYYQAC